MKRSLLVLLFVSTAGTSSLRAEEAEREQGLKKQAEAVCDALLKGEFGDFVDLTYPKLVEKIGGREKMIALLKKGRSDLESKGIRLSETRVEAPRNFAQAGEELIAVVPYTLEMKGPGAVVSQKSYLLGVSGDDGASWKFLDGSGLDEMKIKLLLPDFPADFKLPKKQPPVRKKA